ncbi:Peptidase C19, ubiquitin carboxyl-terminal hydrolase [Dillenia turbinata]|uniref:Ubiquitin carboxyl-terminal hydrolase n=1 Tax=Dillenia turbinata TaxID=194707 RepID=A0AAN8ZF16_9MAGN
MVVLFRSIMTIAADSGMLMVNDAASCLPCTPDEQKRVVQELTQFAESNLKEGNTYFLISNGWFAQWQNYVGQDATSYGANEHLNEPKNSNIISSEVKERPGPIDNLDLLLHGNDCKGNDPELLRTLEEGRDYVLVPQGVWEKLFDCQGVDNKQFSVEVYPLCLKLTDSRDNSQSILKFSKKASIRELYEKVCMVRGIEKEKARIWDYFNKQKYLVLAISDRTLEESNLQMDQDILLEVQVDGFWPPGFGTDSSGNELALVPLEPSRSSVTIAGGPTLSNGYSTSYNSGVYHGSSVSSSFTDLEDRYSSFSSASKGDRGGLAGLQNLGNTCFMNSAIQCLVHTPPLVEYFLQDFTDEINKQNPLGMHGELALAFGELLRKLWSSGRTPVAPRQFKGKLARFAPQFSGYNQHDSQELLAFLLDGLHEDLNRVKQKPYIEAKDANGRPHEEVAEECWKNHKARNDSLIVDVCQGQYKSTLVCPVCNKISITFDPFMYLSIPLPSTITRTMTVTVFYGDGSGLPMPFTVTVLKHGCCRDLCQALGTACCLRNDESLLLAEVYEHRIYRYFENPLEPLTSIKDDEHIIAYRLLRKRLGLTRLEIIHCCQERCIIDSLKGSEKKLFGTPLVTYVGDEALTGSAINIAIRRVLSPLQRKTYVPLTNVQNAEESGSCSEVDRLTSNCSTQMDHTSSLEDHTGLGEVSSIELTFQISVADDRGLNCKPLEKDSCIKPGQFLRILLDWTEKDYEEYDASYLKDLPEVCKPAITVKKTRQEAISLFSCLEAFLKEEPLGPDDMWYCPSCKEHRQATKKLDLWRLPDILVFHLKRFSYSRYLKNKLDTFVNFPIHNLDLGKYVKSNNAAPRSQVYELYAIINHYGGLGGGHYSAHAKLIDENRWYHFDDSHVSPVGENEIKTSAAYVLFYQRSKADPKLVSGESSQGPVVS